MNEINSEGKCGYIIVYLTLGMQFQEGIVTKAFNLVV
jgi:hypothetical protein